MSGSPRPRSTRGGRAGALSSVVDVRSIRRINFARLNHILIPTKKPDRDRLRKSVVGKAIRPAFWFVTAFSREGRVFAVAALLIGAAGVDVSDADVFMLFAGMVGLIVASFVLRPFYSVRSCQIEVACPPRVSVGAPQAFTIAIYNASERDQTSLRIERPFLPWDGKWVGAPLGVSRIAPHTTARVATEATFVERGEHQLDAFEVAALVPIGLSVSASVSSGSCRFLVVPRVANVEHVALDRAEARHAPKKSVAQVATGEDELAGVRPYRPGDPLKLLHARTWARTGIPHVRQLVSERSEGIALVLAVDGSPADEFEIEAAVSLTAGVASFITRTNALEQLLVGDDALRVSPARGRAALDCALDKLALVQKIAAPAAVDVLVAALSDSVTSVVIVTADRLPARKALRDAIARAGLPVRWVEVLPDRGPVEADGASPSDVKIEADRIVRGEAVAC